MSETKRTKNIAFRVTDEDYARIEKASTAAGDDANNWCRKAALNQLTEGHPFTKNERLIYQEIALLRFLLGHGFKLLFSRNEATAATCVVADVRITQRRQFTGGVLGSISSGTGAVDHNLSGFVRQKLRSKLHHLIGRQVDRAPGKCA